MKKVFALCFYFFSTFVYANDQSNYIDFIIKSFIQCDDSFFLNLFEFKQNLDDQMPIKEINPNRAYIAVNDRKKNANNYVQFDKPILYQSLKLTGYYDNSLALGEHGDYYFLGFSIDNALQNIRLKLDFLLWTEVKKESMYAYNMKIYFSDDSIETWHDNLNTNIGVRTIPAQGTAEKLLLLEKTPNMNLLVCSLQGFFPPELLTTIRPDLNKLEDHVK